MQTNMIIHSDNFPVLQSMPDESVDLCYIDPPFNTGGNWSGGVGGYSDKFHEIVPVPQGMGWIDDVIDANSRNYIAYMAWRLLEIHRVLKLAGHFFLHCDWRESANLQILVNSIFGKARFKNEIIWNYPKSYAGDQYQSAPTYFAIAHNSILWWERTSVSPFNPLYMPFSTKQIKEFFYHKDSAGRRFRTRAGKGRTRYYADECDGIPMTDVWALNVAYPSERMGYPTQKSLALLNRIIKCGSDEGGLVLDAFCGAGTACLAARNNNRKYIGIDTNDEAVALSHQRLGTGGSEDSDV